LEKAIKNMIKIYLLTVVVLLTTCKSKYKSTPKEYKNTIGVGSMMYQSDTSEIRNVLMEMLNEHLQPFRPKELFDATSTIYLDTVIYSPDKLKMVALVITENSTTKLLHKTNNAKFFFNGNYLFCSRTDLTSKIFVYDYSSHNIVHYYKYNDIKTRLHEYCFKELSSEIFDGEKGYNIDDLRFWNSKVFKWVVGNSRATALAN
jgi:hypothetical protein